MQEDVSLERLDRQLAMCTRMLGDCASLTRDLGLNAHENIKRIGEALRRIFEIQDQIYELRPDLTPEYLKKEWDRPRSESEDARDALARLTDLVHGHRLYLERLEHEMSELQKKAR